MREQIALDNWLFTKADRPGEEDWQGVTLPHTWNNLDGQDGGDDYYRGLCRYRTALPNLPKDKTVYVEFEGANHIAEVYLNGESLGVHEGGFSTFRFELSGHLKSGENELSVSVFNGESHVYPQMADFTFFGGLYRPARLIIVETAHFDLSMHGSAGVFVTPAARGEAADIRIDAFSCGCEGCEVLAEISNAEGGVEAQATAEAGHSTLLLSLAKAQRWNGLLNPYLYTARVTLVKAGAVQDEVVVPFGVREYSVDADKGFYLNGEPYPLHGVSRHQDRLDMGWALTRKQHEEDTALIREVGANTIRLAHYQHARDFYDICDSQGFVLWAEIPFISMFIEDSRAKANTISQMTELIAQNYNHASIFFWGISNEITMGGETSELSQNLNELNTLAKKLDPSRLTTMAQLSMVENASPHNFITDVLSYNHYFGWYMGDVSENGPVLDAFHKENPTRPVGVSEYGAEANIALHSAAPGVRDYSEEYQALYHENMLKIFAQRPYLWSTHVWNMFDFAADARDEGGCRGRNNKGLVSYDRKTCKDAFYIYKAYWTSEPFVYITGRRFEQRLAGKTEIKVYSNCARVTLCVDGGEPVTLQGDKVFCFADTELLPGSHTVSATAPGTLADEIILCGVLEENPAYRLPEETAPSGEGVANWFEGKVPVSGELQFPEGYFSVRDTVGDIAGNPETMQLLTDMMSAALGDMAKKGGGMLKTMVTMMKNRSLESLLQMAGSKLPKGTLQALNVRLNEIKKN